MTQASFPLGDHPISAPIKRFYNDLETTGTDPIRCGIIQFSAIVIIDGQEKASLTLKMQPFPDDEIEEEALEQNGIKREELFADPERKTPKEAYKIICQFLARFVNKFNKKDKFFWIGYNAQFDSQFLREFFRKKGDEYFGSWFFTPPLCVMILSGYLLMRQRLELENMKLRTMWEYLFPERKADFTEDDWHDALFDIRRTIEIEAKMRQIIAENRKQA